MTGLESSKKKVPILFTLGIFFTSLSTLYLNSTLYPGVALFFPYAREIATIFGIISYAAIGLVAIKAPHLLNFKALNLFFLIALCLISVPVIFAIEQELPVLSTVLLCIRNAGIAWSSTLLAITVSSFSSKKALASALIVGIGASGLISGPLVSSSPFWLASLGPTLFPALIIILLFSQNKRKREIINRKRAFFIPEDLQPFPLKVLAQTLGFVALFGLTQGFSLAVGVLENTPFPAEIIAVIFIVLLFIPKNAKDLEDNLFILSSVLVIIGYLIMAMGIESIAANSLLATSKDVFNIVVWILVAMVGRKNILQVVPFFVIAKASSSLGLIIGTSIGHFSNSLALSNELAYSLSSASILLVFILYLIMCIKKPIFSIMLNRLDSFSDSELLELGSIIQKDLKDLGEEHGLTKREMQVFDLLAKGRNSVYIQERLIISQNTTKTHIKHIYQKFGVHSRQELLDKIDDAS